MVGETFSVQAYHHLLTVVSSMITCKLNPRVYNSLLVLLDAVRLYRVYRRLDTLPLYLYYELLLLVNYYCICKWQLENDFWDLFLRFACILCYMECILIKDRFEGENFFDSKVTHKICENCALKLLCIWHCVCIPIE